MKKNHLEIYLTNLDNPIIKLNGERIELKTPLNLTYTLVGESDKTKFTIFLPVRIENLRRGNK
ncbi:MAG: hypothetical protein KDK36_09640 [Leptospiraceae bacterium]|nr:hypothetical protein [Leptospiraceae bacterium]